MKLLVEVPKTYLPEREYIIKIIIDEYLGIPCVIKKTNTENVVISLSPDYNKKKFVIEDDLFKATEKEWLKPVSLPKQPIKWWDISDSLVNLPCGENKVPVLYGTDPCTEEFLQVNEDSIFLGLDFFGSAFFMLTRYEEIAKSDRDEHDRFPAKASLAYQEGFLNRPIINEYAEIFWQCIKYLWSDLNRKNREFKLVLSHDVDSPFQYAFFPFYKILRSCTGDLVKRKSFSLAKDRFSDWLMAKRGLLHRDPHNKFNFIMDINEKYNIKSTFYFMTGSDNYLDGSYSFEHPYIQELLKQIAKRGHRIGLHPSYNTYRDSNQTKNEFERLFGLCSKLGIEQDKWGGRQHFLRWESPTTWQNYEEAGLHYDTSLSYADCTGFRCGTCYEFPVFNLNTRQELSLIERPLIVMEGTILDEKYMNLRYNEAYETIDDLINCCKYYNGDFTLLWHNSHFGSSDDVELYLRVIENCIG